jgi:ABC-2 type transport system ATP-binding protein
LGGVSFAAGGGRVTALVGPNGAGKTTALGILLGLVRPDAGRALVGGVPYDRLPEPAQTVGAVLDAARPHPSRTPAEHLRGLARAAGVERTRAAELLERVGLEDVGGRPSATLSLGMLQRLRLAGALLGRPSALVLDEPSNGLDPPARRWLRDTLRGFADEGGTVLLSTHLLAEAELLADDAVVLHRGAVLAAGEVAELMPADQVEVETADGERLVAALLAAGLHAEARAGALVVVATGDTEAVGRVVAAEQIVVRRLGVRAASLEEAFFALIGA